jgi:hypothetical protein
MNMETDIWADMRPVREYRRADAQLFNAEVAPGNRPVIMRGLVNHWPAVAAGRKLPQALGELLRGYSTEQPIGAYYASRGSVAGSSIATSCRVSISRSGPCRSARWWLSSCRTWNTLMRRHSKRARSPFRSTRHASCSQPTIR